MPKLNLHTARAGKFAVRLSITAARAAGCSGGDLMADLAVGYGKVKRGGRRINAGGLFDFKIALLRTVYFSGAD